MKIATPTPPDGIYLLYFFKRKFPHTSLLGIPRPHLGPKYPIRWKSSFEYLRVAWNYSRIVNKIPGQIVQRDIVGSLVD